MPIYERRAISDGFGLAARVNVSVAGVTDEVAMRFAEAAHAFCPYSKVKPCILRSLRYACVQIFCALATWHEELSATTILLEIM
eukprot:SAG11_NODE_90_length_17153_cov_63.471033_8_plen_84_part_00